MTKLRSFSILLVAASLALAASAIAAPRDRAAPSGDALAAIPPGTVLWVGAHPDDEVLLAPLLGELCSEGRHRCALVVATRGENGACRLPGGCHPDLATVRTAEMRAAARLFRARVLQGSLPDVSGPDPAAVRQARADAAGGEDQLLGRLAGAIDGVAPQTIITFDPRHGTTCHDAHRAIGRLVLRAVERLSNGSLGETTVACPARIGGRRRRSDPDGGAAGVHVAAHRLYSLARARRTVRRADGRVCTCRRGGVPRGGGDSAGALRGGGGRRR